MGDHSDSNGLARLAWDKRKTKQKQKLYDKGMILIDYVLTIWIKFFSILLRLFKPVIFFRNTNVIKQFLNKEVLPKKK